MLKKGHLCAELKNQIGHFEEESNKHRILYRRYRYLLFGLTAASTVLASAIAMRDDLRTTISLVVVGANALAAFVTSVEGIRKPGELWIMERRVLRSLQDLKRDLDFHDAESLTEPQSEEYFNRMQAILSSSLESWSKQVQPIKTEGHI
jgi:Protein of unknown function (DUF4231)